jgi:hypothetical protein
VREVVIAWNQVIETAREVTEKELHVRMGEKTRGRSLSSDCQFGKDQARTRVES